VVPLAPTRVATLDEIVPNVPVLLQADPTTYEAAWAKAMKEGAGGLLRATAAAYRETPWNAEALKAALEAVGAERGLKLGKAQAPVRVAVTGRSVGLPLFESLEVLGRERTLARIEAAAAKVEA
jgi:glutamyl-tRNA synthetase